MFFPYKGFNYNLLKVIVINLKERYENYKNFIYIRIFKYKFFHVPLIRAFNIIALYIKGALFPFKINNNFDALFNINKSFKYLKLKQVIKYILRY